MIPPTRKSSAGCRPLRALLLSLTLVSLGCGQPTGNVSGTVAYKNKPLANGSVRLMGGDGIPHDGMIRPDGNYLVKGVPVGPAKVMVTSIDPKMGEILKKAKRAPTDPRTPERKNKAPLDARKYSLIPLHYSNIWKSTLSVTVQKGTNTFAIDLK